MGASSEPFAGLLGLCVALWIATPHFATASNLVNVVEQSTIIGIIAVGMTFVILTGGIDLSVGSLVALAGIVFGSAVQAHAPLGSRSSSVWAPDCSAAWSTAR